MTVNISDIILDDLSSRFLVNLPPEELNDPVRVCFQIESAHWFYLDFYKNEPRVRLKDFIRIIFNHLPCLKQHASKVDDIIDQWQKYKSAVPTYGAVLLDEDANDVLLVQGYYATSRWGFPKGKVNEDEQPHMCAIREVKEETGFDISPLINPNLFMERAVSDTMVRLYIVVGVSKSFEFRPETRNEIKKIQWFRVDDLPADRYDNSKNAIGVYANNFYSVIPFVTCIKDWIREWKRSSTNESTRKHRPYSPAYQQTNSIRSAGNCGAKGVGNQNRRQRTQSLSAALLTGGDSGVKINFNSCYISSSNELKTYNGGGSTSTTPKLHKQQQQQYQNKKQKCAPKGRILFDETSESAGVAGPSVDVENVGSGVIRLAQAWLDVRLDWSRILKDL